MRPTGKPLIQRYCTEPGLNAPNTAGFAATKC